MINFTTLRLYPDFAKTEKEAGAGFRGTYPSIGRGGFRGLRVAATAVGV